MYESHHVFKQPEDENVRVWRYMNFAKFVELVESRTLYFARADRLGDPFEGSYPRRDIESSRRFYEGPVRPPTPERLAATSRAVANRERVRKAHRESVGVSCWHANPHESAAMWSLYLRSDDGIAIQSTYKRLRDCFRTERSIYLGTVTYLDYASERLPNLNLFQALVHKLKSYEHEREVRAIVSFESPVRVPLSTLAAVSHGMAIPVDTELLIEQVRVAPTAARWLQDLTDRLVKRLGYKFEVTNSDLDDTPLY